MRRRLSPSSAALSIFRRRVMPGSQRRWLLRAPGRADTADRFRSLVLAAECRHALFSKPLASSRSSPLFHIAGYPGHNSIPVAAAKIHNAPSSPLLALARRMDFGGLSRWNCVRYTLPVTGRARRPSLLRRLASPALLRRPTRRP